jgi:hypothetical protein
MPGCRIFLPKRPRQNSNSVSDGCPELVLAIFKQFKQNEWNFQQHDVLLIQYLERGKIARSGQQRDHTTDTNRLAGAARDGRTALPVPGAEHVVTCAAQTQHTFSLRELPRQARAIIMEGKTRLFSALFSRPPCWLAFSCAMYAARFRRVASCDSDPFTHS